MLVVKAFWLTPSSIHIHFKLKNGLEIYSGFLWIFFNISNPSTINTINTLGFPNNYFGAILVSCSPCLKTKAERQQNGYLKTKLDDPKKILHVFRKLSKEIEAYVDEVTSSEICSVFSFFKFKAGASAMSSVISLIK